MCAFASHLLFVNVFPCLLGTAIDEEGVLCQSREPSKWQGVRATLGASKGKHYYEATVTDEGLCRVGWSTLSASLDLGRLVEPISYIL